MSWELVAQLFAKESRAHLYTVVLSRKRVLQLLQAESPWKAIYQSIRSWTECRYETCTTRCCDSVRASSSTIQRVQEKRSNGDSSGGSRWLGCCHGSAEADADLICNVPNAEFDKVGH